MAYTGEDYKELAQAVLDTTGAALITVTAAHVVIVGNITVVNTSDDPVRCWLYHYNSGGSAADSNTILPGMYIQPGGMAEFTGRKMLDSQDVLWGKADANSALTITVSGLELS